MQYKLNSQTLGIDGVCGICLKSLHATIMGSVSADTTINTVSCRCWNFPTRKYDFKSLHTTAKYATIMGSVSAIFMCNQMAGNWEFNSWKYAEYFEYYFDFFVTPVMVPQNNMFHVQARQYVIVFSKDCD